MTVACITVFVKPGHAEDFIAATVENHRESVKEPGNLRFDVLRCASEPDRFFLYEAYETEEASAAHKTTAHYRKWKETVEPWMARPREGIRHAVIAPAHSSEWK